MSEHSKIASSNLAQSEANFILNPASQILAIVDSAKELTTNLTHLSLLPFSNEPSTPSTFPHFPSLPIELRTTIWQLTLPTHRTVDFPLLTNRSMSTTSNPKSRAGRHPTALSICIESRAVALKNYHILPIKGGYTSIAPAKDLVHLHYPSFRYAAFFSPIETLLVAQPTFLSSITRLEIRAFYWSFYGPRWYGLLALLREFTGLRELYLDFESRFGEAGEMGVRWKEQLDGAKMQLRVLREYVRELKERDEERTIPEVFLHRKRRRMVRGGEEDVKEGLFELGEVLFCDEKGV